LFDSTSPAFKPIKGMLRVRAKEKYTQVASPRVSRVQPIESQIRRVNKVSISEDIAQQILDLIAHGNLVPGQRLPSERELCKNFGAARSSLREALRGLSMIGVLTARVGEGTSVAADGGKFLGKIMEWRLITEKHDIENLLEVRIALEGVAAANMALHGSEADIAQLQSLLAKMKSSVKDKKQFAAFDLEFHVTIARASGNSLLFDFICMIRSQLVTALDKLLLPHVRPLTYKEHSAIVQAIERRDAEGARGSMHAHLESSLARHRATMGKRIETKSLVALKSGSRRRSVKAAPAVLAEKGIAAPAAAGQPPLAQD
jgi:GntR family transcriptional regulator, transcriptional repressor for pyruvate dehydrogenase complex